MPARGARPTAGDQGGSILQAGSPQDAADVGGPESASQHFHPLDAATAAAAASAAAASGRRREDQRPTPGSVAIAVGIPGPPDDDAGDKQPLSKPLGTGRGRPGGGDGLIALAPVWLRTPAAIGTASLIVLVIQNAALVLMTRASRVGVPRSAMYHTSTLVLNQETLKLAFCLVLFALERRLHRSPREFAAHLSAVIWSRDTAVLAAPALLFTLQNLLLFVALGNLDVMTFQILSQTKLLSAAVLSVWWLDKRLNATQWGALVLLSAGVIVAQISSTAPAGAGGGASHPRRARDAAAAVATPAPAVVAAAESAVLGAVACIVSGLFSSFAGVYFERVVKRTPPSLAVRNIQLSIFGVPMAFCSMLILDHGEGFEFWRGYSPAVLLLVVVHAFGGLMVAVVVKYTDNILKGFATAIAIVVSGIAAALLWGYVPSLWFVLGCAIVIGATMIYHSADQANAKRPAQLSGPTSKDDTV